VDIKASGVSAGGQTIDSVTLVADGRTSAHALRFSARQDKRQLTGRINAGLVDKRWSGALEELQLTLSAEEAWTLQQPSKFVVGESQGELRALCLSNAGANICANGDWQSATAWQLQLDAGQLPLELVKPWLAPGVQLDGVAGLRAQARADSGGITGSANLLLNPGSVMLDDGEETLLLTRFGESRVMANLQNNILTAELSLPLEENGEISGQLRIDQLNARGQWFHKQARITSTLALNLTDKGLVSVFVPTLSTTSGQVNGDLVVGGTIGEPLLSGNATLKDAGVTLPQAGIQLRDVNMQVSGSGNTLDLQGSVTSGEGIASYRGQLTFRPNAPVSMDLALTGERLQVANIPEAMVLASPDLRITLREQQLDITGSVNIPEAQIRIRELKGVAKESGDLVLVEQQTEVAQTGKLQVAARINLVLADKVSFDGFGLTGKLDGKVEIIEQPGKVTRGQGELNIKEGQYAVYGQKLEIERGRLVFAGGPIDNPGLDMRVIRKSGDVLAGVRVTGTATVPTLTLFSDPTMEQSDILSYLLLGIPTSKASGAQGAALSGAAASLGLAGGDWISKKLGNAFGIDEVGVESGDTVEESSLVLGKYLSPRLYISYAVGLFDQLNTFRMRYDLSRRWSVQTETGAATGADLLFTLEH
jgi:translocation and assembly module TamB